MDNRTTLKEKRNTWLWLIWFALTIIFSFIFPTICLTEDKSVDFGQKIGLSAIFFCLISIVYRLLTFSFNSFLGAIIKKRWKIDRLKGRVTPIYRLEEFYKDFYVTKYVAEYTELDLEWSVPFSVLFLEREYVKGESYFVKGEIDDLASTYETIHAEKTLEKNKKISIETIKKQKIDNLNKEFNENYK